MLDNNSFDNFPPLVRAQQVMMWIKDAKAPWRLHQIELDKRMRQPYDPDTVWELETEVM